MEVLEEHLAPEVPTPPEPPAPRAPASRTTALKQLREEEAQDLKSVIDALNLSGPLRIDVIREYPTRYEERDCGGTLGHYDEPITEDQIKADHGGGRYKLVFKMAQSGSDAYRYVTNRKLTIPGPPRLDNLGYKQTAANAAPTEQASVVTRALDMTAGLMKDERARADRIEREAGSRNAFDPRMIESINAPMLEQMKMIASEKRAMDERYEKLLARMNDKPDTGFQERFLDKMTDEANRRFDALRTNHDSELRQLREANRFDVERLNEDFKRRLDSMEKQHQRELDTIKTANDTRLESLKSGYEMRLEALKGDITRAERELTKVETEAVALRAKKEKSFLETAQEMVTIKEAMGEMGILPNEDDEGGGMLEKVGKMLAPIVEGVGARVASGAAPPQQQQQEAAPEQQRQPTYREALVMAANDVGPGRPFQLQGDPSGRQWIMGPDRKIRPFRPQQGEQRRMRKAPAPPAQEAAPDLGVTPEELKGAVAFIENAVTSNTSPKDFAITAGLMVPAGIKSVLRDKGSDWFLDHVIKPSDTSSLSTARGRNFLREVAAELLK